jgi:enterochelin esterase family protein
MTETMDRIRSVYLSNERPVWTIEPLHRASADRLTVFLDAELYRDRVGAVGIIEELRTRGQIADSWFVFVSMESFESRWLECPCYPPFAQFVVEELLPWLEGRFPELGRVWRRTLVGLSYTGLAAAFVAKEFPGKFDRVISQSGSFWSDEAALVRDFQALPDSLPTEFYLDVGLRETQVEVLHREGVFQRISQIDGVKQFRDALLERGHRVKYVEFDGGHEMAAWQQTLPGALVWALPTAVH